MEQRKLETGKDKRTRKEKKHACGQAALASKREELLDAGSLSHWLGRMWDHTTASHAPSRERKARLELYTNPLDVDEVRAFHYSVLGALASTFCLLHLLLSISAARPSGNLVPKTRRPFCLSATRYYRRPHCAIGPLFGNWQTTTANNLARRVSDCSLSFWRQPTNRSGISVGPEQLTGREGEAVSGGC